MAYSIVRLEVSAWIAGARTRSNVHSVPLTVTVTTQQKPRNRQFRNVRQRTASLHVFIRLLQQIPRLQFVELPAHVGLIRGHDKAHKRLQLVLIQTGSRRPSTDACSGKPVRAEVTGPEETLSGYERSDEPLGESCKNKNRCLVPRRVFGWCWGKEPQFRCRFAGILGQGSLQLLYRRIPSPNFVDGRVDQQLENEGSEDAADHWCGNTFHYVGTGSRRPHDGKEADAGRGKRHELRAQTLGSPLNDGFVQLPQVLQAVFALCLLVSQIEVQQHEHPCLSIDSEQGN